MKIDTIIGAVSILLASAALVAWRRLSFVVPEGFYGLLYLHGRSLHRLSPGRHRFWKHGYSVRLVDMRKTTLSVAGQQVVSADNLGLQVSAVLTYQIIQAETAMHDVQDYVAHLQAAAQLAIRSVIGALPSDGLLHQRFDLGRQLLARVEPAADKIGIIVHALELKEVALPAELRKVMARAATEPVDFETAD